MMFEIFQQREIDLFFSLDYQFITRLPKARQLYFAVMARR
jgi:hypothetical protein